MRTVVIIGAGHVGSHCAFALAMQGVCDEIILVDIDRPKAAAQALDLSDAVCHLPHRVRVRAGALSDCGGADIAVLAAGPLPNPAQTRLDTLADTVRVLKDIAPGLVGSGFSGILITISNPADVVADYMRRHTGFSANRVFGTGTALDSARLRRALSLSLGIDARSIQAYALGEHGDSQLVAFSQVSIGGKPLDALAAEGIEPYASLDRAAVSATTRTSGFDILRGKGSTEFGIAAALSDLCKAVFHDEHRILPASVLLTGQYGQRDVHAGVPAIIGRAGIEGIVELTLCDEELRAFSASCDVIRSYIEKAAQL